MIQMIRAPSISMISPSRSIKTQTLATPTLQAQFEQAMKPATSTPEILCGRLIQSEMLKVGRPYETLQSMQEADLSNPTAMFKMMQDLLHANVTSDLTSKLAGSLSQSIMRLVSMQ